MKKLNIHGVSEVKLSQEDYENIWLRIKEKHKYWIFGWVSFIIAILTLILVFGINSYIKNKVDSEIQTLINSESFRKDIVVTLQEKLTNSNKNYSELLNKSQSLYSDIVNQIKRLESLKNIPIKCYDFGFEIVDTEGKTMKVEIGHGMSKAPAYFKSTFINPPNVFLTQYNLPSSPFYNPVKKSTNLSIDSISPKYFLVKDDLKSYDVVEFNWIAIGR